MGGRRVLETSDEVVEQVRTAREAYAARVNYHLGRMVEDAKTKEAQHRGGELHSHPWQPNAALSLLSEAKRTG